MKKIIFLFVYFISFSIFPKGEIIVEGNKDTIELLDDKGRIGVNNEFLKENYTISTKEKTRLLLPSKSVITLSKDSSVLLKKNEDNNVDVEVEKGAIKVDSKNKDLNLNIRDKNGNEINSEGENVFGVNFSDSNYITFVESGSINIKENNREFNILEGFSKEKGSNIIKRNRDNNEDKKYISDNLPNLLMKIKPENDSLEKRIIPQKEYRDENNNAIKERQVKLTCPIYKYHNFYYYEKYLKVNKKDEESEFCIGITKQHTPYQSSLMTDNSVIPDNFFRTTKSVNQLNSSYLGTEDKEKKDKNLIEDYYPSYSYYKNITNFYPEKKNTPDWVNWVTSFEGLLAFANKTVFSSVAFKPYYKYFGFSVQFYIPLAFRLDAFSAPYLFKDRGFSHAWSFSSVKDNAEGLENNSIVDIIQDIVTKIYSLDYKSLTNPFYIHMGKIEDKTLSKGFFFK